MHSLLLTRVLCSKVGLHHSHRSFGTGWFDPPLLAYLLCQPGVRMYRLQKSIIYKFVDRHKVRIVLIVEFPIFLYVESYYIYFPKNYHVVYKFQILCQMSLASNLICFDYYHLLSSSSILPRVRRI